MISDSPGLRFVDYAYYLRLARFRFREPWTDLRSSLAGYALFAFFVLLLTEVWERFLAPTSTFTKGEIILYIGTTEALFMTFLRGKLIVGGMEDFAVFLAKPRSWLGREVCGNIGTALGGRLAYLATLLAMLPILIIAGVGFETNIAAYLGRVAIFLLLLALPQALLSTFLTSLRLSFPQTDYFILPFSKLFLAFGGVFAPLSDFGEPLRSLFLRLPGSDLFFQPAYFALRGEFYRMSPSEWALRFAAINLALYALVRVAFRYGKRNFQAWGG